MKKLNWQSIQQQSDSQYFKNFQKYPQNNKVDKQIKKLQNKQKNNLMTSMKGVGNKNLTLQRTLKWLDKTEGRDKFCKMIQYGCRFLTYRYNQKGNKEMQKKVNALFCAMRDARKLFRLLKSIKQLGKILELIKKINSTFLQDFILNFISRTFFLLYWMFDNFNILAKLGLIQKDAKQFGKKGSACWFVALIADLVMCFKNIIVNIYKVKNIRKIKRSQISMKQSQIFKNEQVEQDKETAKIIKKIIVSQLFTVLKIIGDMLPAGQGCQFYFKVFKVNVNQGWCGIGGFISAFLTSYNLYFG